MSELRKYAPGEPQQTQRAHDIAALVGVKFQKLSRTAQAELWRNKACPAGGMQEENYHRDGPRYWEKKPE